MESANQLPGSFGAGGRGGGSILVCVDFGLGFLRMVSRLYRRRREDLVVLHSRRQLVRDHVHFAVLGNLSEAGRRPAGLGVHVERLEYRGLSLRLSVRSVLRHITKRGHLFGSEKLPHIGPALGALLGTNPHQPVPVLHDRQFVAVLDRGGNGRLQRQFLPQVQTCWDRRKPRRSKQRGAAYRNRKQGRRSS